VQNTIKNLTHDNRQIRVRVPVGVSYSSDMRQVAEVLKQTGKEVPWRVKTIEPRILLLGFGSSSVDWEVSVWGADAWRLPQMETDLAERVWHALKDNNITIAFPQVDVHFDTPAPPLRLATPDDVESG
jgi:small-conductance mechanosensitive channel